MSGENIDFFPLFIREIVYSFKNFGRSNFVFFFRKIIEVFEFK